MSSSRQWARPGAFNAMALDGGLFVARAESAAAERCFFGGP